MPIAIIHLIAEVVKLVNLLIEGVPPEIRRQNAITWFWATWPLNKLIIKSAGAPDAVIESIEKAMADIKP